MAQPILVKRSAVPAKVPVVADLALGELAINTYDGKMYLKKDDGAESIIQVGDLTTAAALAAFDALGSVVTHEGLSDPHTQYLKESDAATIYAALNHIHATGNLMTVSKTPQANEFSTVGAALAAIGTGGYAAASATNRYVIKVSPGEFTEAAGLTIPAYVYISGLDPWNSAVLKTSDLTNDFITVSPNGGMFNIAVSGPTTAGKSAIKQVASGTTKLYWVNLKEGSYGITLAPTSGVARCHCIGVVTDGPTVMNRMFNCDNPAGTGVFILMQSGPMNTTWTGSNPASIYLNGDGTSASPKANATIDLCQFRGNAPSGQILSDVYADNGALVRGICASFAGATSLTNTRYAINIGPNNGTGYKTKCDIHGSQIKPGNYTKDIKIQSTTATVSYSGVATEANLDFIAGAQFIGSFADSSFGQVIYGELWVGNNVVKTPLSSYVQADKNTGLVSGGGIVRGAGARQVDVAAGLAFLDTANGLKKVTFNSTTLTIPANTGEARIIVDNTGTVSYSLVSVDKLAYLVLGEVGTNASAITYIFDASIKLPQFRPRFYDYLEKVVGPINVSGGQVTASGLGFDVESSNYFQTEEEIVSSAATGATFYYWYRDGSGGWNVTTGQTTLNTTQYDDSSGTLATMTTGYWRRDTVYVSAIQTGATDFHVFMGQEEFPTEVESTSNPVVSDPVAEHSCRLAALVIQKGASSFTVVDQRPKLGQMAAASTGVTNHNDLAGRTSSTAHTQYQLGSEKGQASGYCELDGSQLVPTNRLPTIAHGNQAGGALHANATTSVAGFLSGSDKTKLDGIATGATANSADSSLRDRTTHTGAQAISTVTGLQTELDSKITGIRQTCVKTADQTFNSATPADVSGMSFTLAANTRYFFKFYLPYRSSATNTGVSFTVNGPASPTVLAYRKTIPTSTTAATIQTSNAYSVHQATASTPAANADQYADLEGTIVTGAAGGTFSLQMSSENTNVVTCRQGAMGFLETL